MFHAVPVHPFVIVLYCCITIQPEPLPVGKFFGPHILFLVHLPIEVLKAVRYFL